jgi:hypothetical protein
MVFGCSIFSLLANKFGVKTILLIGTLGYAPYSASLYVNNRYGTEWFVLLGGATCGIAASALWASEGAIALGYGDVKDRGKFSMSCSSYGIVPLLILYLDLQPEFGSGCESSAS